MDIPAVALRHEWLRFEDMGLNPDSEVEYLRRLRGIYYKRIFRVPVLDFGGLEQINEGDAVTSMRDRLEMIHTGADGEILFRSHVWRSLFSVRGPLIRELMLEFFSTVHYRETDVELGIADTLVFRLGGVARQMSMQEFILALGLHTEEDLASPGFADYWTAGVREIPDRGDLGDYWVRISSDGDSTTTYPSYTLIREPMRRLCHRLIALTIAGRGQSPEKVTTTDLFFLRSMDEGAVLNVPHLLALYLYRIAAGRQPRSAMSGGHFVSRLAVHFGVITDVIPAGLEIELMELPLIDPDYLVRRLGICEMIMGAYHWVALGAPRPPAGAAAQGQGDDQDAPAAVPAAQEEPQQAPHVPPPPPAPRTAGQRLDRVEEELRQTRVVAEAQRVELAGIRRDLGWVVSSISRIMEHQGISHTRPDGVYVRGMVTYSRLPQRRVRRRTDGASTSGTHSDDQTET